MAEDARRVAVVGAGPSGLTAALFLARRGVPVLVLERGTEVFEDPRAATFHPPTLEMFAEAGVTDALLAAGLRADRWQLRGRAEGPVAEFDLACLAGDTPFPFRLQCEQHKLVRILLTALATFPHAAVRWGAAVQSVEQDAAGVAIRLPGESLRAAFAVGADGGRSAVRKSIGVGFEGFTYPERFLVVATTHDFVAEGYALSCYVSDPEEWCALFKVPHRGPPGLWRVVFPTPVEAEEGALLDPEAAEGRLQGFIPRASPYPVAHTNLYTVHQRVASRFRQGRVLLAGDAAHVNNPLGGMGMNFGIHDGIAAAEAIAAVLLDGAEEDVLDRYDRRRRHVANAFLQSMTIANKRLLEEKDTAVRATHLAELRATAADPARARAHLLRTSMIEGVRAASQIA